MKHVKTLQLLGASAAITCLFFLPPLARAQDEDAICSCSPTEYRFKLNFDGNCEGGASSSDGAAGGDEPVCFYALSGSDAVGGGTPPSEDANATRPVLGRRLDMSNEFISDHGWNQRAMGSNGLDLSSHIEHARKFAKQMWQGQMVEQRQEGHEERRAQSNGFDTTPTIVISVSFVEFDYNAQVVINQDSGYFDTTLRNGQIIKFASISTALDPSVPLTDQIEFVPGGVMLVMFGVNSEGQVIQNTLAWGVKNDDCAAFDPVSKGWVKLEDFTHARAAFCPSNPPTTTVAPDAELPIDASAAEEGSNSNTVKAPNSDFLTTAELMALAEEVQANVSVAEEDSNFSTQNASVAELPVDVSVVEEDSDFTAQNVSVTSATTGSASSDSNDTPSKSGKSDKAGKANKAGKGIKAGKSAKASKDAFTVDAKAEKSFKEVELPWSEQSVMKESSKAEKNESEAESSKAEKGAANATLSGVVPRSSKAMAKTSKSGKGEGGSAKAQKGESGSTKAQKGLPWTQKGGDDVANATLGTVVPKSSKVMAKTSKSSKGEGSSAEWQTAPDAKAKKESAKAFKAAKAAKSASKAGGEGGKGISSPPAPEAIAPPTSGPSQSSMANLTTAGSATPGLTPFPTAPFPTSQRPSWPPTQSPSPTTERPAQPLEARIPTGDILMSRQREEGSRIAAYSAAGRTADTCMNGMVSILATSVVGLYWIL